MTAAPAKNRNRARFNLRGRLALVLGAVLLLLAGGALHTVDLGTGTTSDRLAVTGIANVGGIVNVGTGITQRSGRIRTTALSFPTGTPPRPSTWYLRMLVLPGPMRCQPALMTSRCT